MPVTVFFAGFTVADKKTFVLVEASGARWFELEFHGDILAQVFQRDHAEEMAVFDDHIPGGGAGLDHAGDQPGRVGVGGYSVGIGAGRIQVSHGFFRPLLARYLLDRIERDAPKQCFSVDDRIHLVMILVEIEL